MGIKYFFKWFRDSFPKVVTKPFETPNKKFKDVIESNGFDNPFLLLLDLNGIIHTSCQKIYKYGSFEPKSLLRKSPPIFSGEKDLLVFEDVLENIEVLVNLINPEEIVLCIDGVAPISKQIQQRQRRFLVKKTNGGFDSNCISPGTDFLYNLGLYLKSNIEKKLEETWLNVSTIYFMDSLVPGEGEHKLFDFLRSNKTTIIKKKFNIIIAGNDADLIMLSLLVSTLFLKENLIYILREDIACKKHDFLLININQFKKNIMDFAVTKPKFKFCNFVYVVCDFVILCFLIGNDFLPSIPLFNIYDGGLDLIMKSYFTTPGYISYKSKLKNKRKNLNININFKNLMHVFKHIFNNVNPQAIQHYKNREIKDCPNSLLDIALREKSSFVEATHHYLKAYSIYHKINDSLIKAYLNEILWIFNYYAYGGKTVNWNVYYPSQYAPTSFDLLKYLSTIKSDIKLKQNTNDKIEPFFQLLCILPPQSSNLLPKPLDTVLSKKMIEFHPKEIKIDYEGKLNEWEGIPILPSLNYKKILSIYQNNVHYCSKEDLKKNTISKQLKMSVV